VRRTEEWRAQVFALELVRPVSVCTAQDCCSPEHRLEADAIRALLEAGESVRGAAQQALLVVGMESAPAAVIPVEEDMR
jgi:hypothetical protein